MPKSKKKVKATKKQPQGEFRPCECDDPHCYSRNSDEVKRATVSYIEAFLKSKTKILKKKPPKEMIPYCCINCRHAGTHLCGNACFTALM